MPDKLEEQAQKVEKALRGFCATQSVESQREHRNRRISTVLHALKQTRAEALAESAKVIAELERLVIFLCAVHEAQAKWRHDVANHPEATDKIKSAAIMDYPCVQDSRNQIKISQLAKLWELPEFRDESCTALETMCNKLRVQIQKERGEDEQ